MGRLEETDGKAPLEVLKITCGVDVQDDRLEVERVGWCRDLQSWSLDCQIFYGDPVGPELWRDLDEYLLTPTECSDGTNLPVYATVIDSGGQYTLTMNDKTE